MEFPVDESKELKKKELRPDLILRPRPTRSSIHPNKEILFYYLKDIEDVGVEGEEAFAKWIYDFCTDFLTDINLKDIPRRELAIDNWMYDSINEYYGLIDVDSIDVMDRVNIYSSPKEKILVDVYKPLHKYPWNSEHSPLLINLSDNLSRIALYEISRMEEELLNKLRTLEIMIVDRYTLIPSSVLINLVKHEEAEPYLPSTYLVNIFIEFDFIDEKTYLVGGSKYKEGESRFPKRKIST